MPTITINIASGGHPINGGTNSSTAGHMWITLPNGSNTGRGPRGASNQLEINITERQINDLQNFVDHPENSTFSVSHNTLKTLD